MMHGVSNFLIRDLLKFVSNTWKNNFGTYKLITRNVLFFSFLTLFMSKLKKLKD